MHVVLFEDFRWHALAPFTLSRPVFALASGMSSLIRKQIRHLRPTRLTLWVRPEMEAFCRDRVMHETGVPTQINVPLDREPALLMNGRTLHLAAANIASQSGVMMGENGAVVAALTAAPGLSSTDALQQSGRWLDIQKLPAMALACRMMETPADLIHLNDQSIIEDFAHLERSAAAKPAGPYHLLNDADVWLGSDVSLAPGCVLDASKGPVILANGAAVGPNSVIQGPCYIGPGSTVAPLAMIRPGTTIGPMCKVGGEVSVCIFLGYSNKAHEGFLGHSYLGKWVNLGAGTTTSNLKNTYGTITLKRGAQEIQTGRRFLGALIGDHTKTAILTRLMSGSYVGFCSMLAGSSMAPRYVPSYTFWTDKGADRYQREKAIEVAQRVFTRRERAWTETDEMIMNYAGDMAPKIDG